MGGGGTFPTPFKITFASLATFAHTGSPTIPEKDAEAVGHSQNLTWSLSHPKQQRTHRLCGGSCFSPNTTTTVRAQPPHTCQTLLMVDLYNDEAQPRLTQSFSSNTLMQSAAYHEKENTLQAIVFTSDMTQCSPKIINLKSH